MWFTRVTFGESLAEIAREEGVDYAVAHARFGRIQGDLRKWATRVAAAVVAVLVAVGAYWRFSPPDDVGSPPPQREPSPPHETHEQIVARELRLRAFDACGQSLWAECTRELDEAKLHDPYGEAGPEVVELRQKVEAATKREPRSEPPSP
jgi:hypothetical protein